MLTILAVSVQSAISRDQTQSQVHPFASTIQMTTLSPSSQIHLRLFPKVRSRWCVSLIRGTADVSLRIRLVKLPSRYATWWPAPQTIQSSVLFFTGTTTATMTPPTSMIHICEIDVRVGYREEALVLVVVERVGGKVCADIGEEEDPYLCLDQDEDEDL
ncbi:hypothetical protein M404DRAFT_1000776 [Pisolithus tinctorius Marx 270]|uniref:Uncharacterized protein n=1 Tax=Pisolithus tinctorius Marx 270 TaxID=870435 RepID=A0A0C3P977_PISTI|nr:hypothetical protein M404DRAFT_1000776 [Pisolithus tinctorius Marx 270]